MIHDGFVGFGVIEARALITQQLLDLGDVGVGRKQIAQHANVLILQRNARGDAGGLGAGHACRHDARAAGSHGGVAGGAADDHEAVDVLWNEAAEADLILVGEADDGAVGLGLSGLHVDRIIRDGDGSFLAAVFEHVVDGQRIFAADVARLAHVQLFGGVNELGFFKADAVFVHILNDARQFFLAAGDAFGAAFGVEGVDVKNDEGIDEHVAVRLARNVEPAQAHGVVLWLVGVALCAVAPGEVAIDAAFGRAFAVLRGLHKFADFLPVHAGKAEHEGHAHFAVALANVLTGEGVVAASRCADIAIRCGVDDDRRCVGHALAVFLYSHTGDGVVFHNGLNKFALHAQGDVVLGLHHFVEGVLGDGHIKAAAADGVVEFFVDAFHEHGAVAGFGHIDVIELAEGVESAERLVLTDEERFKAVTRSRDRCCDPFRAAVDDDAVVAGRHVFFISNGDLFHSLRRILRGCVARAAGENQRAGAGGRYDPFSFHWFSPFVTKSTPHSSFLT